MNQPKKDQMLHITLMDGMVRGLLLTATNRGPGVAQYVQEAEILTGFVLGGTGLIDDATVRNVFSIPGDAQVVVK